MISEISSHCPFDIPGLFWREGRFSISQAMTLTTSADPLGRLEITLPDDLMTAVPKRRSEYLAGRLCAALALRAAGQAVHVGRNGRAPVWPAGVAGSISHSDSRAIAVVSLVHRAVGVDCETVMADDLAQKLRGEIIGNAEAQLCPPNLPFASFLTLVFSAKEALFKALYAHSDTIPAFLDIVLTEMAADHLRMELHGEPVQVHHRLTQLECVTLVALGA